MSGFGSLTNARGGWKGRQSRATVTRSATPTNTLRSLPRTHPGARRREAPPTAWNPGPFQPPITVATRGSRNLRLRRTGRRLACWLDRRPDSEIPAPLPRREAPPRLRSETPRGASLTTDLSKKRLSSRRRGGACPSRPVGVRVRECGRRGGGTEWLRGAVRRPLPAFGASFSCGRGPGRRPG
jgi:hypothetical protein